MINATLVIISKEAHSLCTLELKKNSKRMFWCIDDFVDSAVGARNNKWRFLRAKDLGLPIVFLRVDTLKEQAVCLGDYLSFDQKTLERGMGISYVIRSNINDIQGTI